MTEDRNREEPRFSRSGRVLKKTLKMKEMEDFEIKDDRQEKARRHLIHPSKNHKLGDKQTQYLVDEGRGPNSIGSLNLSPSSDISCVEELYSTPKRGCQVTSSSQKTLELHRLNDAYSWDEDRTWSTSEDASSNSESEEESGECLKVHSKQLRLKKNLKTNYAKFLKLPNLKLRARRKTTVTAKMLCTKIKTFEHGIAVSSYYSARKMEKIETINKMLPFTEMCKKLGGAHTMSNSKREAGDIEQNYLQHVENFNKEISYKRPKSGDTVTNQLALQEHQQSPEQLESDPVLGTSPIDVAAHLALLGDNLTNIGMAVAKLDHIGPGVYSSLLDILLCSMGPLLCLTRDIAGLERLPEDVFLKILDHVAYIIPGI